MQLFPAMRLRQFEQLEPGVLFAVLSGSEQFFALKTTPGRTEPGALMAILGPRFEAGKDESFLVSWPVPKVMSYGREFTVIPSTSPEHWFEGGNRRTPICLAVAADRICICSNGAHSPKAYEPRFVDLETGEVVSGLSNALYTAHWRIEIASQDRSPLVLVEYPTPPRAEGVIP
jgi:hypothetical protein